jgi:hypothetical protein
MRQHNSLRRLIFLDCLLKNFFIFQKGCCINGNCAVRFMRDYVLQLPTERLG